MRGLEGEVSATGGGTEKSEELSERFAWGGKGEEGRDVLDELCWGQRKELLRDLPLLDVRRCILSDLLDGLL